MSNNNNIKVECRGGIIVEACIEDLKRVSTYFECLLTDRWPYDKNVPLKLREVSSTFLIEQLEALEDDDHNPYEFLNLSDPTTPTPNVEPTPSILQLGRTEISLNRSFDTPYDIYSQFMIHIDRGLFSTSASQNWWSTSMISLNLRDMQLDITFNEAWVMALKLSPNKIKIYHDRIDLPLFPDFVFLQSAVNHLGTHTGFTTYFRKYIRITSQMSLLEPTIRRDLINHKQITQFTMPSQRDQSNYYFVTGDGLKMSNISCALPKVLYEITPLDEHQFENPFGKTVKTFMVKYTRLYTPQQIRNLFTTDACCELTFENSHSSRKDKLNKSDVLIPQKVSVWFLRKLELQYNAGYMRVTF